MNKASVRCAETAHSWPLVHPLDVDDIESTCGVEGAHRVSDPAGGGCFTETLRVDLWLDCIAWMSDGGQYACRGSV